MLSRYCRAFVLVVPLLLMAWLAPWRMATGAALDDSGTDRSVVVERLVRQYTVEADGSYRLAVEDIRRVAGNATHAVDVDAARDAIESLDAFTWKPDGRRLAASTAAGAGRTVVNFPAVAKGDRLVLRYVLHRRAPRLAGQFDDLLLPQPLRHRDFQVVYDLPSTLALQADAVGFVAVPDAAPAGRRRYRWRYVDGANPRAEAGAVSQVDEGRRLIVSTVEGYPALASAFGRTLAARAAPSADLLAEAVAMTMQDADPHARALALAAWTGKALPHGDAADRALLLVAALAADGVEATPALVNGASTYTLPDAPTLAVLDHVVVFVPALGLTLDPGAGARLPTPLLGKPMLRLDTGGFAMTPLLYAGGPDRTTSIAAALAAFTRERARRRTWVCAGVDTEEESTVAVRAPGARGGTRPETTTTVVGAGLYYTAREERRGDARVRKRRLVFRHGTPTCTAADDRALRPALQRIRRALRAGAPGKTIS